MKNTVFHFQQFSVRQRDSAMKIGTDGVLLGAWATLESNCGNVLDVGTGTGLIALMLAQRCPSIFLDAIEIDSHSASEAQYNFSKSAWANRMALHCDSFTNYCFNTSKRYDHIVCNPPFYSNGYPIVDKARARARDNKNLEYQTLFEGASKLLTSTGRFSLIVPISAEGSIAKHAHTHGFFLHRETKVRGNKKAPFKRLLLEYVLFSCDPLKTRLTLETERNCWTVEHQELVSSFYLSKD